MSSLPMRSSPGRGSAAFLWSALVLGLVAGIAGVALQLWFNPADAVNRERKQIAARATDFSAAYATYDAADLGGYEKRVGALMTDDFRKAFEQKAKLAFASLAQAKLVQGDPRVRAVGISDPDQKDKSAFALVAIDYTVTIRGADQAIEVYDRWLLSMSKVGGEWQVGGYKSLMAGAQAAASLPGAAK